jgi:hypothetical protein
VASLALDDWLATKSIGSAAGALLSRGLDAAEQRKSKRLVGPLIGVSNWPPRQQPLQGNAGHNEEASPHEESRGFRFRDPNGEPGENGRANENASV